MVQAIVLDIEGTTTPIAFVYDVLFPYARAHLAEFLADPGAAAAAAEPIRRLRAEWQADTVQGEHPPEWPPEDGAGLRAAVPYIEWLMAQDRKSPGLKQLQGLIWEAGYRRGELQGQVYPDVAPAFRRWRGQGIRIAIYSSGSELAQRLLFSTTPDGDLTPFVDRFFDTRVGAKQSPGSYAAIAAELAIPGAKLLFVSDVVGELAAAAAAGWRGVLCVRPGNRPQPSGPFPVIQTFDALG